MSLRKRKINGFDMILDPSDKGISRILLKNKGRELAFMSILERSVEYGMTCIDLGANIGYTTLPMLNRVGDTGHVWAIEPDPRSLKLLKKNIALNFEEGCSIFDCAISDEDGETEFFLSRQPNTSGMSKTKKSESSMMVKTYSLETFAETHEFYPNFIKMDVEGHEVSILRGGINFFSNHWGATKILLEVHPTFYGKENDLAPVLEEYWKLGFNTKFVVSTPTAHPTLFKEAGYKPSEEIKTDGYIRGIYEDVSNDDLIRFACYENEEVFTWKGADRTAKKIVRSFLIER